MKHDGSGWIAGRTILCAVLLGMPGMLSAQRSAATFMEGQRVEVREGDIWSPATIIKQEGRRYQIRYEDGTEEWVATDRLRLPGQAGCRTSAGAAGPGQTRQQPVGGCHRHTQGRSGPVGNPMAVRWQSGHQAAR